MIELLFIIGVCWAVARGWDAGRTARRTRSAAAKKRTPDPHKRRAARQAWWGWWVGEVFRLFPVTRGGLAAGWHDHRDARGRHRVAGARRKAEHAERLAEWQAEIAAYLHRLELAAARRKAGPSMSDQLLAILRAMKRRLGEPTAPDPDGPAEPPPTGPPDPPPDDDKRKEPPPDDDMPDDPEPPDDKQPEEPPVTTPDAGAADTTYTEVNTLCEQLIDAAEHAIDEAKVTQAQALADGVGALMRGDAKMAELAVATATAAAEIKRDAKEMQDQAAAMKDYNTKNYGPQVEAVSSSEAGVAAQPGYLEGQ